MTDLRFTFERWLLRGLHYRLFFAAAIVAFVAISAGALVLMLDPNFEEPGEAVWWSFLRLTDPGYLGDDEGVVSRSISTVVTVLGYIVFLGLLIAILTQWMNALILRVESGIPGGIQEPRPDPGLEPQDAFHCSGVAADPRAGLTLSQR